LYLLQVFNCAICVLNFKFRIIAIIHIAITYSPPL